MIDNVIIKPVRIGSANNHITKPVHTTDRPKPTIVRPTPPPIRTK